jgi:hypothetical protein
MKQTSRGMLAALLLAGSAVSYLFLHLLFRSGRALPRLPWTTAPLLLFIAVALFLTAFNVNKRLEERRKSQEKKTPVEVGAVGEVCFTRRCIAERNLCGRVRNFPGGSSALKPNLESDPGRELRAIGDDCRLSPRARSECQGRWQSELAVAVPT